MPAFLLSYQRCRNRGQVLIDIIVATGVFLILVHSVFSLIVAIYETINYSRVRMIARHLANEKMELLLNVPYSDLGTTTGIPNGIIPEFETVSRNDVNFIVHTTITYVDDPFDGNAPVDLLPTDYKQVRLEVAQQESSTQVDIEPIVIVSQVAPQGIETVTGGGTLSILVIDAQSQPVSQAQVHVVSSDVVPVIDMTLQTNIDGRLIIPGAPPCANCYNVTVSKDGYSTDKTYTTDEVANPQRRPITVEVERLSEATFIIDRTSNVTVYSHHGRLSNFSVFPNQLFRLTGSKIIGTDPDGDPVYKFDETFTTSSSGLLEIEDLEWDNYMLTIPPSETLVVSGVNPFQPMTVNPNTNYTVHFALSPKTLNSLLLSTKDASGSAIASASATLSLGPDVIATQSGGLMDDPDFGQVFFSDLDVNAYDFTINHSNYQPATGTVTVDGTTVNEVILTVQ